MRTPYPTLRMVAAGALVAIGLGLPATAHAATRPTATWKVTELGTGTTYATKTLFSTNSGGAQTWTASGACSIRLKRSWPRRPRASANSA